MVSSGSFFIVSPTRAEQRHLAPQRLRLERELPLFGVTVPRPVTPRPPARQAVDRAAAGSRVVGLAIVTAAAYLLTMPQSSESPPAPLISDAAVQSAALHLKGILVRRSCEPRPACSCGVGADKHAPASAVAAPTKAQVRQPA